MKIGMLKISNKIIISTNWYSHFWGGVTKFWNLSTFNIDVVNLGSNSGRYAFNYSETGVVGANWAVGPQSLLHDYNILRNYFSCLNENAIVIISLTPFSSLNSEYSKESNLKYYTILHPATIAGFEEKERIKALKIKNNLFKEMPFFCIKETLKDVKNGLFKKRYRCNYESHAEGFIEMWKNQFGITDLDAELSNNHKSEQDGKIVILDEMLSFCLERNLRPVLVIPPMHSALSNKMSPTFRENYIYSFIKRLNVENISFHNYMDHPSFREDKYYANSFFMSEVGAKIFTQQLLKDLNILN